MRALDLGFPVDDLVFHMKVSKVLHPDGEDRGRFSLHV